MGSREAMGSHGKPWQAYANEGPLSLFSFTVSVSVSVCVFLASESSEKCLNSMLKVGRTGVQRFNCHCGFV
jgi:hypothetical protein